MEALIPAYRRIFPVRVTEMTGTGAVDALARISRLHGWITEC